MMLSIFGSETFVQGYDIDNSIYLLINSKQFNQGKVSLVQIEEEITKLYEGEYSLVIDS